MTFWRPSPLNIRYLVAPTGAGLIFISVPASPASTAGGGDSPSYSGFFHCLAVFDDQGSPCFNPNSGVFVECTKFLPTGLSPRVDFWFITCNLYFNLRDCLLANKLCSKIYSMSSYIYYTVKFFPQSPSSLLYVQIHEYYISNKTRPLFTRCD